MKSLAKILDGLSMWMLKSPRRITVGDIAHTDVSSDENSLRKTGFWWSVDGYNDSGFGACEFYS